MKINYDDRKITVYLFQCFFNDEINKLNHQVKEIVLKLIKRYHINLFGYSQINIYTNKKYGSILEIKKLFYDNYDHNIIDLKIVLYRDIKMYLEFDDYFFIKKIKGIISYNNKYYLDLDIIPNLLHYIEHGNVVYEKNNFFAK